MASDKVCVFTSCVFSLILATAFAGKDLQCFTCNSKDNPNCPLIDFDESTYTKSEMNCNASTFETMNSVQRLLYPNTHMESINTLAASKITEDRCVKFTASHPDVGDEAVTFRGCFMNGHYSCRHIEGVLGAAGAKLEQCDQCKHKVYCNSSSKIAVSHCFIFSLIALIMAKTMRQGN